MNFKNILLKIVLVFTILLTGCASQKKLSYLNNPPTQAGNYYSMDIPDYKIQNRDVLQITLKAMNKDGVITDYLGGASAAGGLNYMQGDAGGYLYGYNVGKDGNIFLPLLGAIKVEGLTLDEVRIQLQDKYNGSYKNAIVECKLLSFKFTVIGEVRSPGTYVNYNNYLTVLEAIGRAGGIGDFGKRDHIIVVRPFDKGTKTFTLNLQDKSILSSEAYFLLPNDVVIVEPLNQKIFNLNLSTYSFIITAFTSALTTTLLLINYLKK
jgi:polysaccharide biosynthesis/export protein